MLVNAIAEIGARGRGRTGTPFRTRDFKSLASTNFATRAGLLGMWRRGSESNRRIRSCSPLHNHSATAPENTCLMKQKTSVVPRFGESGAGNGTSTDALSVCFPTLFFAEGLNEGLNFSLVFGRRQRRPSTNFHSPPTPSAHLRATPCRGSPLHRVRVRELSAHLSALHS